MNTFLKAISICLISVVLWLTLSNFNKNIALLLSMAVCCCVMFSAYQYLEPVLQLFTDLRNKTGWDSEASEIILKATGIGMITELTALICSDSGNAAMAKAVRILSVAAILWLSLPMFTALLELVDTIMGAL